MQLDYIENTAKAGNFEEDCIENTAKPGSFEDDRTGIFENDCIENTGKTGSFEDDCTENAAKIGSFEDDCTENIAKAGILEENVKVGSNSKLLTVRSLSIADRHFFSVISSCRYRFFPEFELISITNSDL